MRAAPLLGLASLVVVVAGLRVSGGVVAPIFLGLVLVLTVAPLVPVLRRRGMPGGLGVVVVVVASYAILLAFVAALAYAVAQLAGLLPTYAAQLDALVTSAYGALAAIGVDSAQIASALGQINLGSVIGFLQGLLGQLAGTVSVLALILTVLLFMAVDSGSVPERLRSIEASRPGVVAGLRSFADGTRRFVLVYTIFGLIIAVLDVIVLTVLGVPLPFVFGLVALIANYIPSIGFIIAMAPPALLALLDGGPELMLAVIGSFAVINVVLQTFVQPRFVGEAVGLSITITFLSVVFWGWVLGVLGALLAIPLTLLAKALLVDVDPRNRWINAFLADRPPPADGPAGA
ncbi:AI-2E family transporter [Pseudonocardia sp. CNS-139]|nr:AI-2E family transporter [Pseudonocardia sp. CNS-139]